MAEENLHNEAEIRRFLLGEMTEDEKTALEEKFVADEDLFEQMRVVEDELIESHIRGSLSAAEEKNFERSFLSTKPRRRRVGFARTMLEKLAERKEIAVSKKIETAAGNSSVWDSIANFFKIPKLAFGAAFAILVLIFGGWLLQRNSNQTEIARQITPTPTIGTTQPNHNSPTNQLDSINSNTNIAGKNPVNKNASPDANRELPNKNQNSNTPKQDSIGITPVLALFAGTVRAEGKIAELNLPKNARGANLQLNLESQDYKTYRLEIVDPDGNLILKNNNLKAKNSKINFFVPAQKLQKGDYIVKLFALNTQNENESVADYTFRVNSKQPMEIQPQKDAKN